MNQLRLLEKAIAKLHRKHQRTWMGHCKCGWRQPAIGPFGDPEPDHSDHVARIIADVLKKAIPLP